MAKKEFISMRELIPLLDLSRSTILRLQQKGKFPLRREISDRRVGWSISEIENWVATRPYAKK